MGGLPRFLEVCDQNSAKATFFSEATLVHGLPHLFQDLATHHEIGCHSYDHEWLGVKMPPRSIPFKEELRTLTREEKTAALRKSSQLIADIVGKAPKAFKAPFNSIDDPSLYSALEQAGFDTDSSLPSCNSESFSWSLGSAPTRHVFANHLWREGEMRLVEVPFTNRPQPLLFHPYDTREEILETVSVSMDLAIRTLNIQLGIDELAGRDFTLVHVTSHPWEFSTKGCYGIDGKTHARNLARYLDELRCRHDVEFLTVREYARKWENRYCPLHSIQNRA
jgi:peptidoglycan/xylan/chitin deacetylase (PgdA/CDA1 family)